MINKQDSYTRIFLKQFAIILFVVLLLDNLWIYRIFNISVLVSVVWIYSLFKNKTNK